MQMMKIRATAAAFNTADSLPIAAKIEYVKSEKRKIEKFFERETLNVAFAGNWNFGGRRVCIFTQISLRKIYEIEI